AIESNNAASIMKRFQAAAQQYNYNSHNTDDNDDNFSAHNEPIENFNAENIVKKLQNAVNKYYQKYNYNQTCRLCYLENSVCTKRRKRQQQYEVAKETPLLYTFWNQEKLQTSKEKLYNKQAKNKDQLKKVNEKQSENKDQLEKVNKDGEDIRRLSKNKIKACNLLKKILATLENLALDIEKENINSEIWVILPMLRFAPPLTISLNTAKNYLKKLGYVYKRVKKDIYIDEHEIEDVKALSYLAPSHQFGNNSFVSTHSSSPALSTPVASFTISFLLMTTQIKAKLRIEQSKDDKSTLEGLIRVMPINYIQ
ncbi:12668_t:CDS:2, partial [Cetraspora pellucida]